MKQENKKNNQNYSKLIKDMENTIGYKIYESIKFKEYAFSSLTRAKLLELDNFFGNYETMMSVDFDISQAQGDYECAQKRLLELLNKTGLSEEMKEKIKNIDFLKKDKEKIYKFIKAINDENEKNQIQPE